MAIRQAEGRVIGLATMYRRQRAPETRKPCRPAHANWPPLVADRHLRGGQCSLAVDSGDLGDGSTGVHSTEVRRWAVGLLRSSSPQ